MYEVHATLYLYSALIVRVRRNVSRNRFWCRKTNELETCHDSAIPWIGFSSFESQRGVFWMINDQFTKDFVSLKPRSHNAGDIWKRCFNSDNASNVFFPYYAVEILTITGHFEILFEENSVGEIT